MKIRKLIIKNYKSIKNLEVDSFQWLNIFIGKNDAGKSNIINALDILFNANIQTFNSSAKLVSENLVESVFEDPFSYQFFNKSKKEAEITVHIAVEHRELAKNNLSFDDDKLELVISRKIFEKAGKTKIALSFMRVNKEIIIKTPDEKKRFLTKNKSYSEKLEDCVGKDLLEKLSNEFILVPADRNIVRNPHPLSEKMRIERYIRDSLINLANSKDEDRRKLFSQFTDFINDISPLIDSVKSIKKGNKVTELKFLTKKGEEISLSTIGGGNNELMLLLHEIIVSGGKLLAIEEPEIHLHPEAERKLFRFMEEFSKTTQMFIVTHSPVFVEPFNIRGLFRIAKKSGETKLYSMNVKDHIDRNRLEQELNTENCEMFFADKVLLVEGISDKIMMEGLISKYCKSAEEIKVVSSYSKDNFDIYVKLLRIFRIPYSVMTDLDSLKGRFQIKIIWHEIKGKNLKSRYDKIDFLKTKNIYVLSQGDLERSYPRKYRRGISKPLDALYAIHNINDEDYNSNKMKDLREVIEALEK